MNNQFVRFLLVGFFNTCLGYTIIFSCMYLLGLSPILSNALGYLIALLISFILNRTFTFRSRGRSSSELLRFLAVFAVAYCVNLAVLYELLKFSFTHEAVSQILAGIVYVILSYMMNKFLVFRSGMPK